MRRITRIGLLGVFVGLVIGGELRAQTTSAVVEFDVHAGAHERIDVPVVASVEGVALRSQAVQLYEVKNGTRAPVPSQYSAGTPDRLAWILAGRTAAGAVRRFELRAVEGDEHRSSEDVGEVEVADSGESLRITARGRPVLEYRYAPMAVPEGVDEVYSLSGFIHPLWSPRGEVLTRIQPPDHYHHYGIWNPWTRTEFEGRSVDFWNVGSRQGLVRADQVLERTSGRVFGGFRALHEHVDHTAPTGDRVALKEQWEVTVWNVGGDSDAWLIDFASTLDPATDDGLTIEAYRYQGFSLRATEKWNDETARLLTSEGFDKSNGNSTRARWIDVNGIADVEAGRSGVLFMSHPANYNHPEHLRIWPVGQNEGVENVFVNFNPAQDRDWRLEAGRTYGLKYRMFVYDGEISAEQAERLWRDYADPPHVEVRLPARP